MQRPRRDQQPVEEAVAQPAPPETAAPAPATPASAILALQRSAGNAAVTAAISKRTLAPAPPVVAPPDPRAVAVEASDPGAADKLSLAEFNGFSQRQADWAGQPKFLADPAVTEELRQVLMMAQEGDGELLDAAGELPMKGLRDAVKKERIKIRSYAKAIKEYQWTPAKTVADAVEWGAAAEKLTAALGPIVVKETIKQGTDGNNLNELVKAKAAEDYAEFVAKTNPLLTASNGMEVQSFLQLRAEGNWRTYHGAVGPIRNLHHFTKAALEGFKTNVSDTSRKKPLAVVLHSTVDHNGAFHRDKNIADMANAPQNNTILIEGSASLDAAGASLTSVVSAYGQGVPPKARQIMLAGHGDSRVTELAGDRGADGKITDEAVDLDKNSKESLELIETMLANLDNDPNARIALNGCLTASASATPKLPRGASPAERKQARDDLAKELQAKRSLADTIRDMGALHGIKPGQVSAANSSFGNEVALMDPKTGNLGLSSPDDPLMTSADKFAYVAQAGEATGAGRALVECIIADPVKAADSAKKRLGISRARTSWDDAVIKAMFREALLDINDIAFINIAADLAGGISECQFDASARPWYLWKADGDVFERIFKRLEPNPEFANQTPPLMKIVAYEVWMHHKPDKAKDFLKNVGKLTVQEVAPLIHLNYISSMLGALLPDPPSAQAAGELRVALLDVAENADAADPASIAYLRKRRAGAAFAKPREITAALGGRSSASSILETIKEPEPVGPPKVGDPAPPEADYNVDTDGDGKNDVYVEPFVKNGVNVSKAIGGPPEIAVHQKPDDKSPVLGKLPDTASVNVIGKSGEWYCIEYGPAKKPGFAKEILAF